MVRLCVPPRTEHCWHQGPFVSTTAGQGWQSEQCCFCPAQQQTEYELRVPDGHGPNLSPTFYRWFLKKEAS